MIGKNYDLHDQNCRISLLELISRAKCEVMSEVMFFVSQELAYHKKMVSTLEELSKGFEDHHLLVRKQKDERVQRRVSEPVYPMEIKRGILIFSLSFFFSSFF